MVLVLTNNSFIAIFNVEHLTMEKNMAITTAQKNQIINWVNSSVYLNELIEHCYENVDTYCSMRDRGINVSWMLPLTSEPFVGSYLREIAKLPFVHSPSMNIYIAEEILKKYGSLLDKKMDERLKLNNIQTDF